MRIFKTVGIVLILTTLLLALSGCELYRGPYSFRQESSNIDKIEVCSYEPRSKTITPVVRLTDTQAEQVMNKLSSMECTAYVLGDHPRDYGRAMICIYYIDGEVEMIGLTNIGWITPDGKRRLSNYTFKAIEVQELIFSLVGENDLPELRADPFR